MSKPLTAPVSTSFDRPPPIPAGLTIGRCYSLVNLGLQKHNWQGQDKIQHKIQLGFELPKYRMEFERDGETKDGPRVIGARLTLSMHKKATLRKYIESWFGKKFPSDEAAAAFDLRKLIGKPVMINVQHSDPKPDGTVYNNIASLAPVMVGMEIPHAELDPVIYTDSDDTEAFEKLPKFLQEIVINQLQPEASVNIPGPQFKSIDQQMDDAFVDAAKTAQPDENPPEPFDDDIPF